jgi:hypothetical protein
MDYHRLDFDNQSKEMKLKKGNKLFNKPEEKQPESNVQQIR